MYEIPKFMALVTLLRLSIQIVRFYVQMRWNPIHIVVLTIAFKMALYLRTFFLLAHYDWLVAAIWNEIASMKWTFFLIVIVWMNANHFYADFILFYCEDNYTDPCVVRDKGNFERKNLHLSKSSHHEFEDYFGKKSWHRR